MPTEERLEMRYVSIGDVKPWDKNPKKHDKKALIESIKRFKRTQPILVQKGTMRIIAGHGRVEASKALGYEDVPVIEVDMPDAEAKAYAMIDNQTTIKGGWDDELLTTNLAEVGIELPDLDMSIFGFTDRQLGIEADDEGIDFEDLFQVIIDCKDEDEQERIYNELTEAGYECKPLTL